MQDTKINQNFNKSIISPKFRASQNVTKPVEAEDKKALSSSAKWAIGIGLTALASYGIYYALTRGRVKTPTPSPTPTPSNPIEEIKGMAIDIFKKDGRFENGKAILADGTKYTGNIISTGKDGSKVVMEYVDGILQKSTKTAKDGTKIFDKAYRYDKKGLISVTKNYESVFNLVRLDGKNMINTSNGTYTIDTRKNKMISSEFNGQGLKKYLYSKNNELKAIKTNGEIHIFDKTGKNIDTVITGNRYKFYDNDGTLVDEVVYEQSTIFEKTLHYDNLSWKEESGAFIDNSFEINKNGLKGKYKTLKRNRFSYKEPLLRHLDLEYKGNKYAIFEKDGSFVIKKADSKNKYSLEVKDDEYNEVMEQAKIFMRELKSKYRKSIGLRSKAEEAWWIKHSFDLGLTNLIH